MTQSFPPDPQNRNERQDEIIAVVLAIAAAGGILLWGVSRGGDRLSVINRDSDTSDTSATIADAQARADGEDAMVLPVTPQPQDEADTPSPDAISSLSDDVTDSISSLLESVMPTGEMPSAQVSPSLSQETRDNVESIASEEIDPSGVSPNRPSPESADTPQETSDAAQEVSPEDTTPLPPPTDFTDVRADYWAKPYIDKLSQLGIVEGSPEGEFRPDADVNRAEFAASLRQAFAPSDSIASFDYSDIAADYWAKDAIDQATQLGFMSGYPDESFRPESPVTRLEVVIALATGLDLAVPDNPEATLQVYGDRNQIPDWAAPKIAAATAAGLVINHPDVNQFEPNAAASRAESLSMIYLAIANQQDLADIPSEYRVMP